MGFVKGMIVGALIPAYLAYQYHKQFNASQELLHRSGTYVQEMITHTKTMEHGLRLWRAGGEYKVVQESLDQAVENHDAAAAQYAKATTAQAGLKLGLCNLVGAGCSVYLLKHPPESCNK